MQGTHTAHRPASVEKDFTQAVGLYGNEKETLK